MESKTITRYKPFLMNSPMSAFLGLLLGLLLSYFLAGEIGEHWAKLYTFVVTGLISLFVAAFAIAGVLASIQAQDDREQEARRRKRLAADALLPVALSSLCKTFSDGAKMSLELAQNSTLYFDKDFERKSMSALQLSPDVIEVLKNVIEFHGEEAVANRLADLLIRYQVAFARWQGDLAEKYVFITEAQKRERTMNWVSLYALASSLFDYSRNEGPVTEIDLESIETAFKCALGVTAYRVEEQFAGEAERELNFLSKRLR